MIGLRRIPADNLLNLRDLGGYAAQGTMTQYGRFFRCDKLANITEKDRRTLEGLGIKTVIDLRDGFEIKEAPNSLAEADGVDYHVIPLMETPREEDGRIVGVPADVRDMADLYVHMADSARGQIVRVMDILCAAEGAALFHCTAGKDRTGIIAALLLSIAGVNKLDVVADYVVSAVYLKKLFEEIASKMPDGMLIANVFESKEETITAFLDHIDSRYGGYREYLLGGGLGADKMEALAAKLLGR